jgi:HAD superfamily hydrolase (TIGR01490 family)
MTRRLALFDLDNTLLAGDSDHAWGEFLISRKLVDPASHRQTNDRFYQHYLEGRLDINAYVRFTLTPILNLSKQQRQDLHAQFMAEVIAPMIQNKSLELIARHKQDGDYCLIITATNSFITAPIAAAFGVDQLLATDLEMDGEHYTGQIQGIPCYQQGKVEKLQLWLSQQDNGMAIEDSAFYSDSINDLPLLERVAKPVAVDPDDKLARIAEQQGWLCMSLRDG